MEPLSILEKFYYTDSRTYKFLLAHSKMVAEKALKGAEKVKYLNPDMKFIEEASLLHDVGIYMVSAPKIGCIGPMPYVAHGYLGREILEKEGYPVHALVCERHVGAGIAIADIEKFDLPLPKRDMLPVTIEEKVICWADKFYSKWPAALMDEKSLDKVRETVLKYGEEQLKRFDEWQEMFG